MKKIKNIDIVFENCDVCKLEPSMFCGLIIHGITKEYFINCYQYENGEVNEYINCREFSIAVNKKGQEAVCNMGEKLGERLKSFNDITHIDLHFEDGGREYITVPWAGEEFENTKQKVETLETELVIHIKE